MDDPPSGRHGSTAVPNSFSSASTMVSSFSRRTPVSALTCRAKFGAKYSATIICSTAPVPLSASRLSATSRLIASQSATT